MSDTDTLSMDQYYYDLVQGRDGLKGQMDTRKEPSAMVAFITGADIQLGVTGGEKVIGKPHHGVMQVAGNSAPTRGPKGSLVG